MTLFDVVFAGNDAVFGMTEKAIDDAIAANGADKAVALPDTAYSLPCYYAVTGTKVGNLGEMKAALGVVKTLMTREKRLNDVFMSGVATALCAEFIETLKYMDGATPYEAPCYGHLGDAIIRELGVPLVTGDIPGVAVILGAAPTAQEGVDLVKSYQAQGILVTLVGGIIDQCEELGYKTCIRSSERSYRSMWCRRYRSWIPCNHKRPAYRRCCKRPCTEEPDRSGRYQQIQCNFSGSQRYQDQDYKH